MAEKERTACRKALFTGYQSIFVFASPYLIFGERGKTVWGILRISNLHYIFSLYIFSFQSRIEVAFLLFGRWNLSLHVQYCPKVIRA